jgi:hypothetical protein
MGTLSVQEFLAGREPCDVCDATGNQQHCISELLSRQDSCILFNAIGHNQSDETFNDTALLQELRYLSDPSQVLDYYIRSTRIVQDINSRPNSTDIWNYIHNQYLGPVLQLLRSRNREATLDAILRIVNDLEKTYGVKH